MTRYLEILGKSFTVPDPDSVAFLSAGYDGVCVTISDAKTQLSAIGSPSATARWTGQAADKFAARLGGLPGQLELAWQSCNIVARALASYAGGLRPVVSALNSLAYQAEEAEGTLRATRTARDAAVREAQGSAVASWNIRVAEAQAGVENIDTRLYVLLGELSALSADCARQIRQAQHDAIRRDLVSDLGRYLGDIGHTAWQAGDDIVHVGGVIVGDLVVKPFVDLYQDLDSYLQDPNLAKYATCLNDISSVLGILALVAAPVPGLCEAFLLASLLFAIAGTAAAAVAAAKHEEGWGEVGWDAAGLALAGGSRVLGQGVENLARGAAARATAKSLWNTGVKHFFDLPPIKVNALTPKGTFSAYGKEISTYLHAGAEGRPAPVVRAAEHEAFLLDRINDELGVLHDLTNQESSAHDQ
jgi:hypothetical protein